MQDSKKCWLTFVKSQCLSSKYPKYLSKGSIVLFTGFDFFVSVAGKLHKTQGIHVKNASQVHCHQCLIYSRCYLPKTIAPVVADTDRKKDMPRWLPLLLDGLTAPMHSVNLLKSQFVDLEDQCVAYKTFNENKAGEILKRSRHMMKSIGWITVSYRPLQCLFQETRDAYHLTYTNSVSTSTEPW